MGKRRRLTIEDCRDHANSLGGKCLADTFINKDTPIQWECAKGHQWLARFGNLRQHKQWCPICARDTAKNTNILKYGVECVFQAEKVKDKIAQTNIRKYGDPIASRSELIKANIRTTNQAKYGVDCVFQAQEIKDKIVETTLKNYGVPYGTQCEAVMQKARSTNLQRYGVEYTGQSMLVRDKMVQTNIQKYGYASTLSSPTVRQRIEATNIARYGAKTFAQSEIFRQQLINNTQYKFADGSALLELKYAYDTNHTSLSRLYKLGLSKDEIIAWINDHPASSLEMRLVEALRSINVPAEYNNKKISDALSKYRPDIKITDNIFVEADGLFWHSEVNHYNAYHLDKRQAFQSDGREILQFREDEIRDKIDIVCSIVASKLGKLKKIGARSTVVKDVSASDAALFFNSNHLMGHCSAKKYIGLYCGDELISCMSFKSIKDGIDISRFATKMGFQVLGGLSKLISAIEVQFKPAFIQSFVDLRYGNGNSLIKAGFTLDSISLGWKWTDRYNTYNRLRCRANMDDRNMTEREYAAELGWTRIYDAGQAKYIKRVKNG